MAKYYLPGIGGQVEFNENQPYQSSPLLNTYSPRLFGAPPQLTHLNDMRLMSANPEYENTPGPVGDFYLTKILQNAQIANFVVGRALFTGGMNKFADVIRIIGQYAYALNQYSVFDESGNKSLDSSSATEVLNQANLTAYQNAMANDDGSVTETVSASSISDLLQDDVDGDAAMTKLDDDSKNLINSLTSLFDRVGDGAVNTGATLSSALLTSLSVQQPFYTFESDWNTYINNVKMMINTAVIMLGLQSACVRIGDNFFPIGMDVNVKANNDVWSNYRFITASDQLGDVTAIDDQSGDTSQYVSFMVEPMSLTEGYTNTTGQSQIYSKVLSSGNSYGNEIAFLTNTSKNAIDDAVINIAGETIDAAESVLSALTGGVGRFTAAIAGGFARSFIGDHTIFPKIFQEHSRQQSMEMTVHLSASAGDPYSYLTEILVPLFFILGMALPSMSKNNASAYAYPPLIQCNIPGMWGTRLGMVSSVSVTKNPGGKDLSVHGYPLSIDVTIRVEDLQNVLMTSGMNKVSTFLNNHTMFDYIAQCAGVDKYRINGSIRLTTRLLLASSAVRNVFHNTGDALLTEWTSIANRYTGTSRM